MSGGDTSPIDDIVRQSSLRRNSIGQGNSAVSIKERLHAPSGILEEIEEELRGAEKRRSSHILGSHERTRPVLNVSNIGVNDLESSSG